MVADVAGAITCSHVATSVQATWLTCVLVCSCVCARVHVCVSLTTGLSILFRMYGNPLDRYALITYASFLGDLAHSGVCDRVNQLCLSIFT